MVVREKSDYLRKEVLLKNFFLEKRKVLCEIRKEKFYYVSLHIRIKTRAEELWMKNPNNSDLDNWLEAEKQVKLEEFLKNKKIMEEEKLIDKCLTKFYLK
tara:strand:- start:734 stop:1033 length:300 start_codon:yes stop_codon:yes gene_type:complete